MNMGGEVLMNSYVLSPAWCLVRCVFILRISLRLVVASDLLTLSVVLRMLAGS